MGFIEDELQDVRNRCEQHVQGSRIVSCVRSMVRIEIKITDTKAAVVCMQFPEEYPSTSILCELKSKTLSDKFLYKLTGLVEQDLRKQIGGPQILRTVNFIRNFLIENPLCCCYDEIIEIKKQLSVNDEIKLKQKNSSLQLKIQEANYFVKTRFFIPDNYPLKGVGLETRTNFPPNLERFLVGQARETCRRCVEPPVRQPQNNPFRARPSLLPTAQVFLSAVRSLPNQPCQYCKKSGLPHLPQNAEIDETCDEHVERLFCNHLFHLGCLVKYMKTPPFQGGKKCLECGERIYHDKWNVSDRIAEERWAHQEAKRRELEDVAHAFL